MSEQKYLPHMVIFCSNPWDNMDEFFMVVRDKEIAIIITIKDGTQIQL